MKPNLEAKVSHKDDDEYLIHYRKEKMKIDKPLQSVTTTSIHNEGKRRTDNMPDPNTATENNVHLSSSVTRLQNIEASATINTTQVQAIKQAINEGNFQVNSEVVADRLLETVKELIQSKKGSI